MNDSKMQIIMTIFALCLIEISWLIPSLVNHWRDLKKSADSYLDKLIELRKNYKFDKVETDVSHLEEESKRIIRYFSTIMFISIVIPYLIVIVIVGILFVALTFLRPFFCVINKAEVLVRWLIFSVMLGTIPIMAITGKTRIHQRFSKIKLYIWDEKRKEEVRKK